MIDVIDDLVEKMDDKNLQNFYGDTPLHVATFNNQIEVVKKLEKILKQCRSNENEGSQSSTEFCCDMKCILF